MRSVFITVLVLGFGKEASRYPRLSQSHALSNLNTEDSPRLQTPQSAYDTLLLPYTVASAELRDCCAQ